ncbi:MAG: MotA/TolQ/ExbB proton channel family protein [Pseudomonadota bacterium]
MVTSLFRIFLLLGTEWVLWALLACSLLALAVAIDRWRVLSSQERIGRVLWKNLLSSWQENGIPVDWAVQSDKLVREYPCPESRALNILAKRYPAIDKQNNIERPSLLMQGFIASERIQLDRFLPIMGTLGNSAPFIGLFGTVLGIIRAFAELDKAVGSNGLASVSGGLAEALVTTAAGLLVAIPCAISYNYFQRKIKIIITRTQSMSDQVIAHGPKQ